MKRTGFTGGGLGAVLIAPAAMLLLSVTGGADLDTLDDTCQPAAAAATQVDGLDAEQARNASIIVTTGQAAGVPTHGLQIALATAMQESTLRNLDYGDRDSIGLFQQRPTTGWGTLAQLRDPVYAARAFYGGPHGPNTTGDASEPPGLLDIPGWQDMRLTDAAQAVQRSAHPEAYQQWADDAETWLTKLISTDPGGCNPGGGLTCPPTGLDTETGLTPDALRVLRCLKATFPQITTFAGVGQRPNDSDHPTGRAVDGMIDNWATPTGNALGWQVAEWARTHAICLGVTYVIFDASIWSPDRAAEGWRPYEHPNRGTDATSLHRNHIHISVDGYAGGCLDGTWVVPLEGDYRITATFGQHGGSRATRHTGIDLAAPIGRTVLAASGGTITYAAFDGPYGQKIEITHPDGTRTSYAHLHHIDVEPGETVTAGDPIGTLGTTGNTTGPHLHFELRPGPSDQPVDPLPWMAERGAFL